MYVNTSMVLGSVNILALFIIIVVVVFMFIELKRFKRADEEILHYLSKPSQPPPPPAPK